VDGSQSGHVEVIERAGMGIAPPFGVGQPGSTYSFADRDLA
jgi:hypothetical protein